VSLAISPTINLSRLGGRVFRGYFYQQRD